MLAVVGVAACGTGVAAAPGTPASRPGPAGTAAVPSRPPGLPGPSDCTTGPARRAWAMAVGPAGRVAWQVRLPTDPQQAGIGVQPLVVGGTTVFAEVNGVYALRLSDGRQLWRKVFPQRGALDPGYVYGLWQWDGSVIVLVGQVSSVPRLMSLDAGTGAVRWTLPLSKQGVYGSQALTGDGGLALIQGNATLTVVDLATGRVRWSRAGVRAPAPIVAGGVVVAAVQWTGASGGSVSGYDTRTGALLWTRRDMPQQPQLAVSAGRVLVYTAGQNVYPRPVLWPVTALSAATGRTLWQAATAGPVAGLSAGPSGVAVTTVNPGRLELIDPVTGRARWNIAAAAQDSPPADTGTDLLYLGDAPGGRVGLVDLRAADGSVRWVAQIPLSWSPGTASPAPSAAVVPAAGAAVAAGPVLMFGADAVVAGSAMPSGSPGALSAFRLSDGAPAWTATVPTLVHVPPAVAGSDLLVQPTDPSYACAATGAVSAVGHAA